MVGGHVWRRMSSSDTQMPDQAQQRTDPTRYEDLAADLRDLDDVDRAAVESERLPPRVRVHLATANVTPPVADRLDEFDADIVPDSVEVTAGGTLTFAIVTPELFRPAGSRGLRQYGSHSTAWTFTHDAVAISGFDADTMLDAYARDGAVLLVEREGVVDADE